jgi:uncharacterized membrane protein YGL010W
MAPDVDAVDHVEGFAGLLIEHVGGFKAMVCHPVAQGAEVAAFDAEERRLHYDSSMDLRPLFLRPLLRRRIECYAASHQARVNQGLHYVGIPLAVIAALGCLAKVRVHSSAPAALWEPNLGLALLVLVCGWYIWASPGAGLLLLAGGTACYIAGAYLPVSWLGGLAALGFALHTVGHFRFEGRPPSFFSRPIAAIEAPVWWLARLAGVDPTPDEAASGG